MKSPTRKILSAYLYEVVPNCFVGHVNYKFSEELLKFFRTAKSPEYGLMIVSSNASIEGFDVHYINCKSMIVDYDGLKFFQSCHTAL